MAIDTDDEKYAFMNWSMPSGPMLVGSGALGAVEQQHIIGYHPGTTWTAASLTGFFAPMSAFMAIGPAASGSPATAKRIFWQ